VTWVSALTRLESLATPKAPEFHPTLSLLAAADFAAAAVRLGLLRRRLPGHGQVGDVAGHEVGLDARPVMPAARHCSPTGRAPRRASTYLFRCLHRDAHLASWDVGRSQVLKIPHRVDVLQCSGNCRRPRRR
jgi:hypothetical protein